MYGSGLSYSRLRSTYDDPTSSNSSSTSTRDRYHLPTSPTTNYGWQSSLWSDRPSASSKSDARRNSTTTTTATMASSSGQQRKPQRYARASTTSVTQLLSDSCSSLLQKLTTRVRGPSATVERNLASTNNSLKGSASSTSIGSPTRNSTKNLAGSTSSLLSTRNKLEDKYSYVLDRIYGRRRDHDKTLEPSVGRSLVKSATTANVILSEKAYPYVSAVREKTPYKNESRHHHHYHQYVPQYPEPPYSYLDRESAAYRVRNRTNHSELRPRRSSKPQRTGKSEVSDRKASLKLQAVEIPFHDDTKLDVTSPDDDETTPTPTAAMVVASPDPVSEREAKRKEIQSLIMKYSALDEAYNRSGGGGGGGEGTTTSAAATIAQKYYPRLGMSSAVSKCEQARAPPRVCGRLVARSFFFYLLLHHGSSVTNKHNHECAFRVPLTLCKSSYLCTYIICYQYTQENTFIF